MNLHLPQTRQSDAELRNISTVTLLIVSSENSEPMIGIKEDPLMGIYKMTDYDTKINRKNFQNLLMYHEAYDGKLPEPEFPKGKDNDQDYWSGRQLISLILPRISVSRDTKPMLGKPIEENNKIVIRDGKLYTGQLNNTLIGAKAGALHHMVYLDYTPEDSKNLLDRFNRIGNGWLLNNGFSIGAKSFECPKDAKEPIKKILEDTYSKVQEKINLVSKGMLEAQLGKTSNEQLEEEVFNILQNSGTEVITAIVPSLKRPNSLLDCLNSGSKGKPDNVQQIMGVIGQIALNGGRIPFNYIDRCLPHYQKYDISPAAKGYVANSFMNGMEATEFFFSQVGGREGIIDTAVKTADTGYIQRKLMKGMEDQKVHYDNTVRNINGQIVQFLYGDDGLDPRYIEKQKMHLYNMSNENLDNKYKYNDKELKEFLTDKAYKESNKDKFDIQNVIDELLISRNQLRTIYLASKSNEDVDLPINIRRLIDNTKSFFRLSDKTKTDMTPKYIHSKITELVNELPSCYRNRKEDISDSEKNALILFGILIKSYLSVKQIIVDYHFTKEALNFVIDTIKRKFMLAIVPAGYMAGPIAAQSIGAPVTQSTLNTFHLSGVGSASKTTRGVGRTKEILSLSKKLKTYVTKLFLTDDFKDNREKAYKIGANIQYCLLKEIVSSIDIYYDPDDMNTIVEADRNLVKDFMKYNLDEEIPDGLSNWLIRFTLDKEDMVYQQVRMREVKKRIQDYNRNTFIIYSDDNANELVIRIKVNPVKLLEKESNIYKAIKNFATELVEYVTIKGIENISDVEVFPHKENKFTEKGEVETINGWKIETNGINLMKLFGVYGIDYTKSYSNDIHEINDVLGIEAARGAIISELANNDISTNYHHLSVLADTMTYRGYLMPIDRHGINRSDIGPIARASFEETTEQLANAAMWSEIDNLKGVSSNIMLGRMVKCGTGVCDIIVNEKFTTTSKSIDETIDEKFD